MIKKILTALGFFGIFIVALIFSVLNFHSVTIHFYLFSLQMPLVVALTLELFAGIAIGVGAALFYAMKKRQISK